MASNSTANSTTSRHPAVDGERDTPEDLYNNVYEWVNCQVSNDPPADGMAASLTTCNITHFFCGENTAADGTVDGGSSFTVSDLATKQGDAAGGESNSSHYYAMKTRPVTVLYDYEVYYNSVVDLENEILPYLDESMLEHVATAMGLVSCRRRRLDSSSSVFPQEQLDRFVGVTRDPVDVHNETYSKCRTNASNIFGDMPPLNETDGTQSSVICLPIKGGLTVFSKMIMNDDLLPQENAIRSNVLAVLEASMDNDLFVVPTSIEKVAFVGDYDTYNSRGGDADVGDSMSGVVNGSSGSSATTTGSNEGSGLSGLNIALIAVGGALFLLICCCCCCCCRRKRRRRRESSKERNSSALDRHVSPVWDSGTPDEEEGQGGMAAEDNPALAELDSLALEPQHGLIKITEQEEDDDSNNTTSGTSMASSSPNRSKERSRASSATDDLELLDVDDNDHDDYDDDSLFEFREGSFSNSLRSPSDTSSRIRSSEFTTNQRGRHSPATTASRSTILHRNRAPLQQQQQQQQQQRIVQATPSNVTNDSISVSLMSMAQAPDAVSRPPSVTSVALDVDNSPTNDSMAPSTAAVLRPSSTASGRTSQQRSVVARDAAYSPTNDDFDKEIMEIIEDTTNDGVSSVASGDSLRRYDSNVSARRNLQMT